jgi:thymidylate kinase/dUTPase
MNNTKGKFIVLYGMNNLGKSTQASLLVDNLNKNGYRAEHVKYPIYDLLPTGQIINEYLRDGNPYLLTPREVQIIFALNRQHFEHDLKEKLKAGINIIAECYVGTGLAWGTASGVDEIFLKHLNSHLLKEDLAFFFDGRRFLESTEMKHRFENNYLLSEKTEKIYKRLATEFGWVRVDANEPIREIEKKLYKYAVEFINNAFIPKTCLAPDFLALQRDPSKILVKRLSPLAKVPDSTNKYTYNLYSHDFYSVPSGKNVVFGTGIKIYLPENYIALITSIFGNFSCVLDSKFSDEIRISWHNSCAEIVHVSPGQKIGQVVFQKIVDPQIEHI